MLLNLLSNAFKFTPDGGSIVLRAETATREELPEKAQSDAGLYPDAALYLRLTLATWNVFSTLSTRRRTPT